MLYLGIFVAAFFWFLMFFMGWEFSKTIHNQYFWIMMSIATIILSTFSIIMQKSKLKEIFKFEWKFVYIGVIHAALLYLLSRFGIWLFTQFFTSVRPQIEAIYHTRTEADPLVIGLLLLFLIGPSEEIFWRGYVQDNFMKKFGGKVGTIMAIALYTLVHIWAFNPMLLLAATVLGIHWSIMFYRFKSIVPGIISHALWDFAIFVVFPITF